MTVATPRRRLPRAERGQQLLDVAEELFIEKGYDRTAVEDIARAAGVTRPIVYEHHGSKEGVYLACVRRARERYLQLLVAAVSQVEDPRGRLRAGADVFFGILEEDPDRWIVLFGGSAVPIIGELGRRLTELRFETVNAMVAMIRAAAHPDVTDEDVEIAAHAISGVGEQLGRWWIQNPGVPRARLVDRYADFIWNGVRELII